MKYWSIGSDDYFIEDGISWTTIRNVNKAGTFPGSAHGKEILLARVVDRSISGIRIVVHKKGKKHRGGVTHFRRVSS